MRILFVAPRYHTNQHPIVAALQAHGYQVHFLVQYQGQSEEYSLLEPARIRYAAGFRLVYFLVRWLAKDGQRDIDFESRYGLPALVPLYRKISRIDPQLVILRNSNWISIGAFLIAKALGKPVLFYTQGPLHGPVSRRRKLLYRLYSTILRGPMPEITPVLGDPHRFIKGNPHAHYLPFVAPQAAQKDPATFYTGERVNILAIGKFEPRKNHLLLLQAIEQLRAQYPIRLTLIGEVSTPQHAAHLQEIIAYIAQHNLQGCVEIRRNLPYAQVQEEYLRHDLFILASRDEPASIAVLEAMAHGLPVISSADNGTSCYIQPGQNGYIIQSRRPESLLSDLIDKLTLLLRDKDHLMQMGAKSYELTQRIYNGEAYCRALTQIVERYFGKQIPDRNEHVR